MRVFVRTYAVIVAIIALLMTTHAAPDRCIDCLRAQYWTIAPDDWTKSGPPGFPESRTMSTQHEDFGIAFSGGGTRSASASIGELRGLKNNGWLDKVRYVAAVSGGSWAAIPFTYWPDAIDALLGEPHDPTQLTYQDVLDVANGRLAAIVAQSQIVGPSFREIAGYYRAANFDPTFNAGIEAILGAFGQARREASRDDKTYTRILEDRFISKLLGDDGTHRFSWTEAAARDIESLNRGRLATTDFIKIGPDRPFLIVGGTMIWQRDAFDYPRLIPVEYTPLYAGARQQFGARYGGTYLSPWAYDGVGAAADPDSTAQLQTIRVKPAADKRLFTLSEVAASSGAAPQLPLLLGGGASGVVKKGLEKAAGYFPSYAPVTVADGTPYLMPRVAHGDGGFTDFFGLMPLLARQVHNIVLFINSNDEFDDNRQFRELFSRLDQRDLSGDAAMNAVFTDEDDARFLEVSKVLGEKRQAGLPLVYCGSKWRVAPNELYNIRGYDDLNICFFYNHDAREWRAKLPDPIKDLMAGRIPLKDRLRAHSFANFPLYKTFEQNPPFVIDLSVAQVNLLSNLTEWVVTQPDVVAEIRRHLSILPAPTGAR